MNSVGGLAGGIYHTNAEITVTGCSFANCSKSAIRLIGETGGFPETAIISDCEFIENSSAYDGGTVNSTVRGNTFYGNSQMSPLSGAQAMAIQVASSLENNIIAGTSGTEAVCAYPGTEVAMNCNVFWENLGGNLEWLEMGPADRRSILPSATWRARISD